MGGDLVLVEKAVCVTPVFKTNARGNEGDSPDGARARARGGLGGVFFLKLELALFYIDVE